MSGEHNFDVFISHASEDKEFARPLAQSLQQMGLKVWFDEFTLKIGDKLMETIDNGLAKSKYGVVIVSKNFFSKNWPKLELEGMISLSLRNISRVLPIWHDVDINEVMNFSPMLASIVALPSSIGIPKITSEIYEVVTKQSSQSSDRTINRKRDSALTITGTSNLQVSEIQNKRFRFILRLYENRDRTTIKNSPNQIGKELGYTELAINEIVRYFDDKGFIEYPVIGAIEITVYGIDYVESLIPNAQEVITVQSNRMKVLKELYAAREQNWGLDRYELGNKLGFTDKDTEDIMYYLQDQGLVESPQLGPHIKITTYGIDTVENSN